MCTYINVGKTRIKKEQTERKRERDRKGEKEKDRYGLEKKGNTAAIFSGLLFFEATSNTTSVQNECQSKK